MRRKIKQKSFEAILHGTRQYIWFPVDNVTHTIHPDTGCFDTKALCLRAMLERGITATHFATEV